MECAGTSWTYPSTQYLPGLGYKDGYPCEQKSIITYPVLGRDKHARGKSGMTLFGSARTLANRDICNVSAWLYRQGVQSEIWTVGDICVLLVVKRSLLYWRNGYTCTGGSQ